jgi:hypothetical protein
LGSQTLACVLLTDVHELPLGQKADAQSDRPSHADALPQTRRQRRAPPWIGLQTVSTGHCAVLPSSEQVVVQ